MNFVYVLKPQPDKNAQSEMRWSLRSVEKYHPMATVTVVGGLYEWLKPDTFIKADDPHTSVVLNVTHKNNVMLNSLPNGVYVYMNDDFILLDAHRHETYYYGTLQSRGRVLTWSGRKMRYMGKQYGEDWRCFERHTPHSFSLKHALEAFSNTDPNTEQAFKTLTGNVSNPFRQVELDTDAKINTRVSDWKQATNGKRYLSLGPKSHDRNLHNFLNQLYPNKSRYESD